MLNDTESAETQAVGNRFKYQSNWMYLQDGIYLSPTRVYSAKIGNFIQPDPMRSVPFIERPFCFTTEAYSNLFDYMDEDEEPDLNVLIMRALFSSNNGDNPYSYAGNNPVSDNDPLGLFWGTVASYWNAPGNYLLTGSAFPTTEESAAAWEGFNDPKATCVARCMKNNNLTALKVLAAETGVLALSKFKPVAELISNKHGAKAGGKDWFKSLPRTTNMVLRNIFGSEKRPKTLGKYLPKIAEKARNLGKNLHSIAEVTKDMGRAKYAAKVAKAGVPVAVFAEAALAAYCIKQCHDDPCSSF